MAVVRDYTSLLSGSDWTDDVAGVIPRFLTYSFNTAQSYFTEIFTAQALPTIAGLPPTIQDLIEKALDAYEAISGVKFFEVEDSGDLNFAQLGFRAGGFASNVAGFAYVPNLYSSGGGTVADTASRIGGDVFLNPKYFGASVYETILHEIGHALGFKHPFAGTEENDTTLATDLDNDINTVMSYTSRGNQTELGRFDVEAAQSLYGTPGTFNAHVDNWMWNGTTNVLTQNGTAEADFLQGTASGDAIFSAEGADTLSGFDDNDTLFAGGGNDQVFGGVGDDILAGAGGNDLLDGGEGKDAVFAGDGADTIYGESGNDELWGGIGNDYIVEYSNDIDNDTIGGGVGSDTIFAGAGDDLIFGGAAGDAANSDNISGNDGNDTVYAADGMDQVFGGAGADLLYGGGGDDFLNGGDGTDAIWGGLGDDDIATGAGADTLGFGIGSGADYVFDFNVAEDRIDLLGQTYTSKVNGAGDLVLTLSGGGTITLNGVSSASDIFIF